MKLWQALDQVESGLLIDGSDSVTVIWETKQLLSNPPKDVITFFSYGLSGTKLLITCDPKQEIECTPNQPYLIGIKSLNHSKYLLQLHKHVPHIPEEPPEELYVFEIKTLIHVQASTLDEAYGLVPQQIRTSASDMVYEYNEEETLAARGNE